MVFNPKKLSWVNPTQAIQPDGTTGAWDAATDLAGIQIAFDKVPAVSVPVALGATSFDLPSLTPYKALSLGPHTVAISVVTKTGVASDLSAAVTFQFDVVPFAPTAVAVA